MAGPLRNISNHLQEYTHLRHGRAIRALQVIHPGRQIFQSQPPLLSVNTGVDWPRWAQDIGGIQGTWIANQAALAALGQGHVSQIVLGMPAGPQGRFRQLYRANGPGQLQAQDDYDIMRRNCWAFSAWDNINNRQGAFLNVYDDISRINHSCRPNVIINIEAGTGNADVIAIRRIAVNEEITVNYLVGDWLLSYLQRRGITNQNWGFQCDCVDCATPASRTTGNTIRNRINQSQNSFPTLPAVANWDALVTARVLSSLTERVSLTEALVGKNEEWLEA